MPDVRSPSQRRYRLVCRATLARRPELLVRPIWPSAFTCQPLCDAWIDNEGDDVLTVYVGDRCLSVIRGSEMDQGSLNQLLDRFRHCPPRPRH